jgi:hypothetical protein
LIEIERAAARRIARYVKIGGDMKLPAILRAGQRRTTLVAHPRTKNARKNCAVSQGMLQSARLIGK